MALPGETIGLGGSDTCDCGVVLELQILRTCAYYIGTQCNVCGPWSRESKYYDTREMAEKALKLGLFGR